MYSLLPIYPLSGASAVGMASSCVKYGESVTGFVYHSDFNYRMLLTAFMPQMTVVFPIFTNAEPSAVLIEPVRKMRHFLQICKTVSGLKKSNTFLIGISVSNWWTQMDVKGRNWGKKKVNPFVWRHCYMILYQKMLPFQA